MKIAIVTDSSSDIYDDLEAIKGIYRLPLQISSDEEVFLDMETIDRSEVFDMMEAGRLFQTSLPPLDKSEDLLRQLKTEGYDLVFGINISTGLSGTTQSLKLAADEVGIAFDYFDAFTSGELLYTYVKAARIMFDKGFSIEDVKARLSEARDHSATYVLPDNLKHLMRSGRVSSTSAFVGSLLKIKPVLYLGEKTNGLMEAVAKPRTMNRAISDVVDRFVAAGVNKDYIVYIVHVRNEATALKMKELLLSKVEGVEVYIKELVTAVAIHVGIGGIASQYTKRININ